MKVLLFGATGFVGRYIVDKLIDNGYQPFLFVRSAKSTSNSDKVKYLEGDLENTEKLVSDLKKENFDALINLIGIIRQFPSKGITFENTHYRSVILIIELAKRLGIGKIIHMSANGARLDSLSEYHTTKKRAELAIIESGLEYTIFKPSVIFGDSNKKMEFALELAKVIKQAPVFPLFGDGLYMLEPVSVKDIATVFVASIENKKSVNQIYQVGGGEQLTFKEIVKVISRVVKKKEIKTVSIPLFLISPMAKLFGKYSFFPISKDQLIMLLEGNITQENRWKTDFELIPIPFNEKNLGYLTK